MKNRKKIAAAAASVAVAGLVIAGSAFAFFVDKDWTSDVGTNGTVYIDVKDLVFTNSENINPGDYDVDVYNTAITNNSLTSLRTGTEHKITFTVDNVGTKSIMTRNLMTITVENTLYEPVYKQDGEAYTEAKLVAPDNHMYYCDSNNPLNVVEDELENKYIKGTEVTFNQTTGKYEYIDAVDKTKHTFTRDNTFVDNIVHWKVGNLPADAYGILYYTTTADLVSSGVKPGIVTKTIEIDCIPEASNLNSKTDLYALNSSDVDAQFEVYARNFFTSKSKAVAIRYVTPEVSLTAPEGSIEDTDGKGAAQDAYIDSDMADVTGHTSTQGGDIREGDLDSVYYTYWLYMDKDAPNIYNGATVYLDIEVQGMQYRNTSTAEWKTLFTKTYQLTVENAEQGYQSIYNNMD